eukprot:CAMPEP_0195062300 /NCGR_PEP_ID=MMETSP0448-20130528/8956_1 /TAXON_ID=66468 /ORGANISM="Heterocapsa triquestra, Strain CCMP 448" /LENGTH=54 /DNA_ID=CAMNT_0040092965 /DNA_START=48 /DNA_END=209 /DNA_ORIENTATION=+
MAPRATCTWWRGLWESAEMLVAIRVTESATHAWRRGRAALLESTKQHSVHEVSA